MDTNKDTLYARWLAGDLSAEEEQALQSSGELEELETVINAADKLTLPKYDATAGFDRFKVKNSKPKIAKVSTLKTRRIWPMIAAAASILLLIFVGNLLLSGPDTIETGNMATLMHQFKDQSSVVLNDGSSIVYDESNWEKERTMELMGEAIFKVEKGRPFIVNTRAGKVEVLGTSFNVRAWGEKLYVECYTGKVQVTYKGQQVILEKGESVNGVLGQLKEKQTIRHDQPLWSTGNSRFYEEPLSQVFEELERQYDVQINAPTLDRPFSGNFRHDDLELALNAICKPMGLEFEVSGDGKVIEIK